MNVNERSASHDTNTQPVPPPTSPPSDEDVTPKSASSRMLEDGQPNWHAFEDDVPCPLCDYNMRGLPSPRCPECGGQYSWPDLLDPVFGRHPFIYEHHDNRNLWSFTRTLTTGLLPSFFWRSVKPTHHVVDERLRGYFWIVLALGLALHFIASVMFPLSNHFARELLRVLGYTSSWTFWGGALSGFNGYYHFGDYADGGASRPILACYLCLACTYFSLQIFQTTMSRAKIKRAHLARVCVYCGDTFVWMAGAGLTVCLINFAYGLFEHSGKFVVEEEFAFYGTALASTLFFMIGRPQRERIEAGKSKWILFFANTAFLGSFLLLISFFGILLDVVAPLPDAGMFDAQSILFRPYLCLLFWGVFAVRFYIALKRYLQVPRAGWIVLFTQTIAALVVANIFVFTSMNW